MKDKTKTRPKPRPVKPDPDPPIVSPSSRVSGPVEWRLDQGIWWGYQQGYITHAQPVEFGDPR